MSSLDPRQHAYRPDLADAKLQGLVDANTFVDGKPAEVGTVSLPLLRRPAADAPMDSQLLPGERVNVFETANGWAWIQGEHDGYVGYVAASGLKTPLQPASHVVSVAQTVVLSDRKQVCAPLHFLSLGARVSVAEKGERFHRLESGGYVFGAHLRSVDQVETDWVTIARRLLGLPYLWGGRGAGGVDCSGLVQIALAACGIECPRDSDQQAAQLGTAVALEPAAWRHGDLIYVPGHVVICSGSNTLIHATGYRWCVMEETQGQYLARLKERNLDITAVRRPIHV